MASWTELLGGRVGMMDLMLLLMVAFVAGALFGVAAVALVSVAHARSEEYIEDGWAPEEATVA